MFEVKIEDHPIDLYIAPDRYEDRETSWKGLNNNILGILYVLHQLATFPLLPTFTRMNMLQ